MRMIDPRLGPRFRALGMLAVVLLISLSGASCGRKGPPTLKSFEKPPPVSDIRISQREDAVVIAWSYPQRSGIVGFSVERGETGHSFEALGFVPRDASQFIDTTFARGRDYLYRIVAKSQRDVLSDSSPVIKVTPEEPPSPPEKLTYRVTADAIEISWDDVSGLKYDIYRSREEGKQPASPANKVPLEHPKFTDVMIGDRPVYYTVRSVRDKGITVEGAASPELLVNPDSFVPSRPSGLRYAVGEIGVYLMWLENPETWVKGYRVYRKRVSDTTFSSIGTSLTPAFKDSAPLSMKTGYFITAIGPKREGGPSEVLEVNPLEEQ